MAERVKKTENITILFNTETEEVLGDGMGVTGARVKNNKTGEVTEIPATGFFVAIGHKPNTDIFEGQLMRAISAGQPKAEDDIDPQSLINPECSSTRNRNI